MVPKTRFPELARLRGKSERSAGQAEVDRAALLEAAVEEAVGTDAWGHLSAVARDSGITAQYLRELVEKRHPGWLERAAAARETRRNGAGTASRPAALGLAGASSVRSPAWSGPTSTVARTPGASRSAPQ